MWKNLRGQSSYDIAGGLSFRQFLLPLQLQAENIRGLAPVLPGITTAQSLQGTGVMAGPPPPPPPPPSHASDSAVGRSTHIGAPPVHMWQPPVADGFASSNGYISSSPPMAIQTKGGPQPSPLPPSFNQYSAFNGGITRQSLGGRYVVPYGAPPPQIVLAPHQIHQPAPTGNLPLSPQAAENELEEINLDLNSRSVM